jgi:hypothetical protein
MEEDIKKMLDEIYDLNQKTYKMTRKMSHYMAWSQFWSIIKILVIVVPLVLGYYYLSPLVKNAFNQYNQLLGGINNPQETLKDTLKNGLDLNNLNLK